MVTRYSSLLGVQSNRVIYNPLPVHPYVQANERTESNSIIELLVRKPETDEKETVCELRVSYKTDRQCLNTRNDVRDLMGLFPIFIS